jgi:lactoylglutathione lyase
MYHSTVVTVSDMAVARRFYEAVLGLRVQFDFGENIAFFGGLSLHLRPHFARLLGIPEDTITPASREFELYFEDEDFDGFVKRLAGFPGVRFLHPPAEHAWGQRAVRFYDPDLHVIEVGESMRTVVRRFLDAGLTPEEAAARTQHPLEFVKSCI